MARVDGNPVEHAKPGTERRWEPNQNGCRVFGRDREGLTVYLQRVREDAANGTIVDRPERKHDIVSGEGSAVGESNVPPKP